jgi:hypothetical protein
MKSPFRLSIVVPPLLFCACAYLAVPAWCAAPRSLPHAPSGARASTSEIDASAASAVPETSIPGPLPALLRMAGISQQASPAEVLPLLARGVATIGYHDSLKENYKPTEFLILLQRYLQQARQLQNLAGSSGVIRVANCSQAAPLLAILGYRLSAACGPDAYLETADASQAFITVDSGFPLNELEDALRGGKPFVLPYAESRVPVLIGEDAWTAYKKHQDNPGGSSDVVGALLHDPGLSRLYWALSQMDTETRDSLRQSPGLERLLAHAPALDFYGSNISIRSGHVVVPGGAAAESTWRNLAGASPNSPGEFIEHLLEKDNGWLAAFYDALSRGTTAQQAYFTDPTRMQRLYEALRGHDTVDSSFRGSYRPDAGLVLLVTQFQLDASGQPSVPGNLNAWADILSHSTAADPKIITDWAKRAAHFTDPEDLIEAMFGISRVESPNSPLLIYLTLSEIDRGRPADQRLTADTVRLLGEQYPRFSDQYLIFSEFRALSNASIADFLKVAGSLDHIRDATLQGNAVGIFEANIGLWQILTRQGQISDANLNDSWQHAIAPFAAIGNPQQLFDAGSASLSDILRDATGKPNLSQAEIITLLAGPDQAGAEGQQVRRELADRIRAVLVAQRLVSLDTILALGDGLQQLPKGKVTAAALLPLAAQLREFELPQQILSTNEKYEYASGNYDPRRTKSQMRTDLTKIIQSPSSSPQEFSEARGLLTPFLRDTLVGLNYAYYEPPGAQILHNDPLFVRSHEFVVNMATGPEPNWRTATLSGRGVLAVGGSHLVGSLADLPYALANAEQDFIVPDNVQALIWDDLVPSLLASAVLPRWWGVTPNELHAVALYQRSGEELLQSAATSDDLRGKVMDILFDCMLAQRSEQVESDLRAQRTAAALAEVTPAETFYLAAEFRRRYPQDSAAWGPAGKELDSLATLYPAEVGLQRLSEDFGIPHPALAQSNARELLNVKMFPTFESYSSRLMAESWESDNLYWARLADELGYPPVMLNSLVPELTQRMVEKIFASHYEDWPAVLRAMRDTGEEFREGKIAPLPKTVTVSEN